MASLATKYRPKYFEEVVGQEYIKAILQSQIKTGEFKNAYLFVGGAGTGKTTTARIVANEINQHQGSPIEIDGASNNGVENVRNIIEDCKYKSLDSQYKIYIIDECVTGDTEILTDTGFRRIDSIKPGERVAQYTEEGNIEFVVPSELIRRQYKGDMYRTFFRNGKKSALMSPHHVQPLRMKISGRIKENYIKDCKFSQTNEVIVAGKGTGDNRILNGYERLYIAMQADGYCGKNDLWEINLSIKEKIERLEGLLKECQIDYKVYSDDKTSSFRFKSNAPKSKKLKDYFDLDMGVDRARDFIDEILKWDGSVKSGYPGYYSCTDKDNVDFVAAVLVLAGYSGNQDIEISDNSNHRSVYSLNWYYTDARPSTACSTEVEHFDGEIFCVKVPSKMIVLRAEGFTFVSGNCHMLSTGAWNAMLKVLEEPPKDTIFILCTTDPQKIPATILSRVQRFDFRRIPTKQIVERLKYILRAEDAEILNQGGADGVLVDGCEDEALEYIAKLADGGMRDSITMLDKVLGYTSDITMENVIEALGAPDYSKFIDLLRHILYSDLKSMIELIEEFHMSGKDLKLTMRNFCDFVLDVCKYIATKNLSLTAVPDMFKEEIDKLIGQADYDFFLYVLDEMSKLNSLIKWEPNPKPIIQATFLLLTKEDDV